jgi:hypothetical protein
MVSLAARGFNRWIAGSASVRTIIACDIAVSDRARIQLKMAIEQRVQWRI